MVFHVISTEPRYYLSVNFTSMYGAGDSILAYYSFYLNCTTMLSRDKAKHGI